jgi:5'-3' exonuclease
MILVIDGNNLANMCSFVGGKSKKRMTNPDGLDTTPVDIFMKRIYTLYDTLFPDSIIICWDKKLTKGFTNFRKADGTYKAQRTGDNEVLYQQCDIIEKLVSHLGIRNIHPNVMEADDIMAWIAHEYSSTEKIMVATFDKDMLQLVNHDVEYFDLRKKEKVNILNFEEINGIKRTRFLLYKMILGDRSDNIQGLKGYGKVKAKRLAENITSLKKGDFKTHGLTEDQLDTLRHNQKMMDLRLGYKVYPEEVGVYQQQYDDIPEKDLDKFFNYATLNNIQYIKDYKWKWEDLCLNS